MSFDRLLISLKGSSSSGNYGHQGRPGKRGGSGMGNIIDTVTYDNINDAISALDPKLRNLAAINPVTSKKSTQHNTDSGIKYDAKADYGEGVITLYDANNITPAEMKDYISHEIGHALYNKLETDNNFGHIWSKIDNANEPGMTIYSKAVSNNAEKVAEMVRVYTLLNNDRTAFMKAASTSKQTAEAVLAAIDLL